MNSLTMAIPRPPGRSFITAPAWRSDANVVVAADGDQSFSSLGQLPS
jgi:hypothetical protein